MRGKVKLIGAALDVLDDPERLALKRAWIEAFEAGRVDPQTPLDPYDAIALPLIEEFPRIFEPAGKMRIPGWLTPRPLPVYLPDIDIEKYNFLLNNNVGQYMARELSIFLRDKILPDVFGMFAVDHGLTAGAYLASSDIYGHRDIALIVLDSHFDAIPTNLRIPGEMKIAAFPDPDEVTLHCGNFIHTMIKHHRAFPENVIVIGPSDYPPDEKPDDKNSVRKFRNAYLSFVEQGVIVIPKSKTRLKTFASDLEKLLDCIKTPYVYISLDADVGSCACMNAVRFMDTVGLEEETIVGIARAVARRVKAGQFALAGFDVAEVDVHLLGLEGPDGARDRTAEVCARFVKTLLGCEP